MYTTQVYYLWSNGSSSYHSRPYAQTGGKRKDREEEVTPAMIAIRADPIIHLLETSGRREAWRCDPCNTKGSGYMSCKNHIESERHQKIIPPPDKMPRGQGDTPTNPNVEPDVPKEKLRNTASSSAQTTPPTLRNELRPHSTARKLEWEAHKEEDNEHA
ncbi:hypothetical protein R1sor_002131 [Riccia sorocarpa]|uniref:Uncharacterized protein n=1 Tax=Riccia sorocarpa TaxID=122646 RepID=A0ABD3H3W4_9MARC